MRAGVVNYCARIDSKIFEWGRRKLRKKRVKWRRWRKLEGEEEFAWPLTDRETRLQALTFVYSTPLGIYYSAYGRGGSCVTHVHFNAITASCRTRPGGIEETAGRKNGDPRRILCAPSFLCSRGDFSTMPPTSRERTLTSSYRSQVVRGIYAPRRHGN